MRQGGTQGPLLFQALFTKSTSLDHSAARQGSTNETNPQRQTQGSYGLPGANASTRILRVSVVVPSGEVPSGEAFSSNLTASLPQNGAISSSERVRRCRWGLGRGL